jgi:hypothetical protein
MWAHLISLLSFCGDNKDNCFCDLSSNFISLFSMSYPLRGLLSLALVLSYVLVLKPQIHPVE